MRARTFIRAVIIMSILGASVIPATSAAAESAFRLDLDSQFVIKTANDLASALPGCTQISGGAQAGLDGWVFDQPAPGAAVTGYILGFTIGQSAGATPVLIGIDGNGVVSIPFSGDTAPPLPDGVAGALVSDGGAWLRTPAGWTLVAGSLFIDADAAPPPVFGLTGVCGPPAPDPDPDDQVTQPAEGPLDAPSQVPDAPAEHLPVTGARTGTIALAGLSLVVLGGVLLVALRRRRRAQAR